MQNENQGVPVSNATDEQLHQPEPIAQQSEAPQKPKTYEHNLGLMRRNYDELKAQLEQEKKEKEEIKTQLNSFKNGFRKVFEPESEEDTSDDELLTKREFQKLVEKDKLQREIEEVPKLYPDYYDVVKFVEPLVKENPALLDAIQNSRNPRLAAYQMVKNSYAYKATVQKQDGKEVEKNLAKPVPSEAIAGGSGIDASKRSMSLSEKAEVWKMAKMYSRGA